MEWTCTAAAKILFCLFTIVSMRVKAENESHVNRLDDYLFNSGYKKHIRPPLNQSVPVTINVFFTIHTIMELSEVESSFTVSGCFVITWTDERLMWEPTDFGNISTVYMPFREIWHPDLTLYNSYAELVDFDYKFLLVTISSNGQVVWTPGDIFKTPCNINVHKFPFDKQTCEILFGSWSYKAEDVLTVASNEGLKFYSRKDSAQWQVVNYSYTNNRCPMGPNNVSYVNYEITLQRNPTYCILNYVCPIITLSVLAVFVFQLPSDSGEKVSYSITTLLAFSVYLSFLGDIMPKTSNPTPYFSIYVTILIFSSALIVLLTILVLKVSYLETEVPRIGKYIVRMTMKQRLTMVSPEHMKSGGDIITWKLVGKAIDRLLFWMFLFAFSLVTVTFLHLMSTE